MEDNGYSVKDKGFIFNIVYRSLLFRSSFTLSKGGFSRMFHTERS